MTTATKKTKTKGKLKNNVGKKATAKKTAPKKTTAKHGGRKQRIDRVYVKALYLQGYTTDEIANMVGSVSGHISKILKAMNVETRPQGTRVEKKLPLGKVLTKVERGQLFSEMLDRGQTTKEIGDKFDLKPSTIANTVREAKKVM